MRHRPFRKVRSMTEKSFTQRPDLSVAQIAALRHRMISSAFSNLTLTFTGAVADFEPMPMTGRVHKALGTIIQATVPNVSVGEIVELHNDSDATLLLAECVGFLDKMAL